MDARRDHLWKVAQEAEDRIEDLVRSGANPVGLDVGTSKIVAARKKGKDVEALADLNAFIPVPYARITETMLGQNNIQYYREGDELFIYGAATERFANMFNADLRRPMARGVLNPREKYAMPVLEAILQGLVPKSRAAGEVMAFSVPAAADGFEADLTYHEATLRAHLVIITPNAPSLDNPIRLQPLGNGLFRYVAPGGGGPVGEVVRFVEENGRVVRMITGDSYVDRVRE